jgi:CheY-like chemotaxis protein
MGRSCDAAGNRPWARVYRHAWKRGRLPPSARRDARPGGRAWQDRLPTPAQAPGRPHIIIEHAGALDHALELARRYDFAIVLLERDLADGDGLKLICRLGAAGQRTPVLVPSARSAPSDKVAGLSAGPTTTWPSHTIRPSWWRGSTLSCVAPGHDRSRIQGGDLTIDLDMQVVTVAGRPSEWHAVQAAGDARGAQGEGASQEVLLDHLYGGLEESDPGILIVLCLTCGRPWRSTAMVQDGSATCGAAAPCRRQRPRRRTRLLPEGDVHCLGRHGAARSPPVLRASAGAAHARTERAHCCWQKSRSSSASITVDIGLCCSFRAAATLTRVTAPVLLRDDGQERRHQVKST